jgi:hypothetical protein
MIRAVNWITFSDLWGFVRDDMMTTSERMSRIEPGG